MQPNLRVGVHPLDAQRKILNLTTLVHALSGSIWKSSGGTFQEELTLPFLGPYLMQISITICSNFQTLATISTTSYKLGFLDLVEIKNKQIILNIECDLEFKLTVIRSNRQTLIKVLEYFVPLNCGSKSIFWLRFCGFYRTYPILS